MTTAIRPRPGRAQDAGGEHEEGHRGYGDVGGAAVQVRDAVEVAGEGEYREHDDREGGVPRYPAAAAGKIVQVQERDPDQDEVERRVRRHPVWETGGRGLRGEPLGEQDLIHARFEAEERLEQPRQANECRNEGAHLGDPAHLQIRLSILQQPHRHAGKREAQRRDGIHRHGTGQEARQGPEVECPADEGYATNEDGHDA